MQDRFRQQAGEVEQALSPGPGKARLVIVDSVRDAAADPLDRECPDGAVVGDLECSPHGWALAHLAEDLLCPGADCGGAVEITTRRALHWTYEIRDGGIPWEHELPIVDAGPGDTGGLYGSRGELAQAIHRLELFRRHRRAPPSWHGARIASRLLQRHAIRLRNQARLRPTTPSGDLASTVAQ